MALQDCCCFLECKHLSLIHCWAFRANGDAASAPEYAALKNLTWRVYERLYEPPEHPGSTSLAFITASGPHSIYHFPVESHIAYMGEKITSGDYLS